MDDGIHSDPALTEREDVDPFARFAGWLKEAEAGEPNDPNAMALATVDETGLPDVRMVLLKGFDRQGFVFFTNLDSAKGRELAAVPKAALCFHWKSLRRQVRIRGPVEPVGADEADAYFATRPRGSQLAAVASEQSRPLPSRGELDARYGELEREYAGREVPRPARWGGYRLRPDAFEFWQHRDNRLHDRVRYTRAREGWARELLAP